MAYITGRAQHPAVKIIKVLAAILVVTGVAGGYLYLHPEIWQKWVKGTPLEPPPAVSRMYKWLDASGQWQISDRPPADGTRYEVLQYRSDENIVPSLTTEKENK